MKKTSANRLRPASLALATFAAMIGAMSMLMPGITLGQPSTRGLAGRSDARAGRPRADRPVARSARSTCMCTSIPTRPATRGIVRAVDVFDAARIAMARGMRGFVYKTHQDAGSASGAYMIRRHVSPTFEVYRPHRLQLRHRRDQRGRARALRADQGRLGPHFRDAHPRRGHLGHAVRNQGSRRAEGGPAVDADDAAGHAALRRGVEGWRAPARL